MRVIALFGRGNIGKSRCLGHLINLINQESEGCNYLFEGNDTRVTLPYLGRRVTICTWGDDYNQEKLNLDRIRQDNPDIAIVATRTKGATMNLVEEFCNDKCYPLKMVEKYVASFDDISGQEFLNNLQAEQMLDYIRGLIEGQLYYVDSKTTIEGEEGRYHLTLLGAEMPEEGFPRSLSLELSANQLRYYEMDSVIEEDDFVLYKPDSEILFYYANDNTRALELRRESLALRQELMGREVSGELAWAIQKEEPEWVKSYHVNVGHGNCSLILSKFSNNYDLWMVDCSKYDYLIRRDYSQDIYKCLKDIAGELNVVIKNLRISRFMLTHTHFDHYNGLSYLIKLGLIDGNTLIYANLHYDCASTVWIDVLKKLKGLSCKFVEPISDNMSVGIIRILHPECRIYKKNSSVVAGVLNRVVANSNNASVVYEITFYNRVMVLPGDLEQEGFIEMSGHKPCRNRLSRSNYYIISHHGSLNGHPNVTCLSIGSPSPLCCISDNVIKAILMGRDKAYSGIYSQPVIDYWGNKKVLEYSEKAPHYLELFWANGKVTSK